MRKSVADTREFFQSRLRGIFLLALVAAAVALAPGGGLTRLMVAVGSIAAAVFSAWLYFLTSPWSGWRPKHQQTEGTILVEIECVRLDPLYQVLCQVVAPDGWKAEAYEPFALGGPPHTVFFQYPNAFSGSPHVPPIPGRYRVRWRACRKQGCTHPRTAAKTQFHVLPGGGLLK